MSEIREKVDSTSRARGGRWRTLVLAIAALLAVAAITAACAGGDDSGTTMETLATMEARNSAGPTTAPSDGSPAASPEESSPVALPEGNADNGKSLATSMGCVACHSIDGSKMTGPTWKGLYGHEVKLDDGSTVTADETYLHDAIMNPNKQVVDGYSPIMPDFSSQLDDQKVADIIAYIQSLQ